MNELVSLVNPVKIEVFAKPIIQTFMKEILEAGAGGLTVIPLTIRGNFKGLNDGTPLHFILVTRQYLGKKYVSIQIDW